MYRCRELRVQQTAGGRRTAASPVERRAGEVRAVYTRIKAGLPNRVIRKIDLLISVALDNTPSPCRAAFI